ncbi:MAG: hypothetical protein ABIH86_00430 [Planctomycetota bacterium]
MNATEKLDALFGDEPVIWVPMWGLSKLRRRSGRFAGAIDGHAQYYDDWYARAFSKDVLAKLKTLGVNLVVLPFSLGGDADIEAAERDDFRRTTDCLHSIGIKSLPYIQYQNILQESNRLNGIEWAVRLDGGRREYCYWRRTPCHSNPVFRGYLKGLVRDAVSRGADGIWIDNTYLFPCRCETCLSRFKDYLERRCAHLLKTLPLRDFSSIELPPRIDPAVWDPIARALIEFNNERNIELLSELKAELEALLPTGLFASNPALYRGQHIAAQGVDFSSMAKLHDILYLENRLFPARIGDRNQGNYQGYAETAALGALSVAGAWKSHIDFDATSKPHSGGLPETRDEIERPILEAVTFNQAIGLFWAARSRHGGVSDSPADLDQLYFEKPDIFAAMQSTLNVVRALPDTRRFKNIAEIAVLRCRVSLAVAHSISAPGLHCACELLATAGIPFKPAFSDDPDSFQSCRLLILPDAAVLSDHEANAIAGFVQSGGALLVIGTAGIYDDSMRVRKDSILKDITGVSVFDRPTEPVFNTYGAGRTAFLASAGVGDDPIPNLFEPMKRPLWADAPDRIIRLIDQLGVQRQLRISSTEPLAATLSTSPDDNIVIQILDYSDQPKTAALDITVRADLTSASVADWTTMDSETVRITGDRTGDGYIRFRLNAFRRYGRLTIKSQIPHQRS